MLICAVFVVFGLAALAVFGVLPAQVAHQGEDSTRAADRVGRPDSLTSGAGIGSCASNGIGRHNC